MPVGDRTASRALLGLAVAVPLVLAASTVGLPAQPLRLEIRVFDALDEMTQDAAVRVYAAGDRSAPIAVLGFTEGFVAAVEPALYDVQIVYQPGGNIRAIRWALALLVERYPGAAGRYVAAVNLKAGHGALQVRPAEPVDTSSWQVTAFTTGTTGRQAGRIYPGEGYVLAVLPVGRYDVRVRRGSRSVLIRDIEVQADHTKPVPVAAFGG